MTAKGAKAIRVRLIARLTEISELKLSPGNGLACDNIVTTFGEWVLII